MNYTELEATLTELEEAPLPPSMQLAIANVRLQVRQVDLLERILNALQKGEGVVKMKEEKGKPAVKAAKKKCPTCKKMYAGKECAHCKKAGMGGKAAESPWR